MWIYTRERRREGEGRRLKLSFLAGDVTDEADLAGLGLLSGPGLSLTDASELTRHRFKL